MSFRVYRSKFIPIIIFMFVAASMAMNAQSRSQMEAHWRIGFNGGINYNLQALGLQFLDTTGVFNFFPFESIDGTGIHPYANLFGEYHSGDWWGAQLRVGFDDRSAVSTDHTLPVEKKFDISISYLTIEPLLRVNPLDAAGLYLVGGPLIGINLNTEAEFTPAPGEAPQKLEIDDINPVTVGFSGGLGWDFVLGDRMSDTRWYLAPFLEGSWMLHQRGRTILDADQDKIDDIWSTISLRTGVAVKMGFMPPVDELSFTESSLLNLALFAPDRYISSRPYEEHFPLVNAVFFDAESSSIPTRYVQLDNAVAATFTENDLLDSAKVGRLDASARMAEQMNVYYNVMNIYGARMRQNPEVKLTLAGSAPGAAEGEKLASTIRDYLVSNFGIDASRITIQGREMPRVPSGSARTPTDDRPLANAENRRVDFTTTPADLGIPVKIRRVDNTPIENDLVLNINEDAKIRTWQLVVSGEGRRETYGPFSRASQRVSPSEIMAGLSEGTFTAEVVAITDDGQRITQTKDFRLVKRSEPAKQALRYSITFGYGQEDPVKSYDNFLRNTVAPQVSDGAKVFILGHTDAIGDSTLNFNLSKKRAGEVRDVVRTEATRLGRKANYETIGYGEEESETTFSNSLPEGRFYNRSVMIEIVPAD